MLVARPNLVLSGNYRLIREIGSGAMGSVWEAEHISAGSNVAIKMMSPLVAHMPGGVDRFMREVQVVGALSSPHVLHLIDTGYEAGTPFMVTELLEGETLEALLARVKRLSFKQVHLMMRHLGRALAVAHAAGVVHRDLKPANIFVADYAGNKLIKLLDFGIAKPLPSLFKGAPMAMTSTGALLGTPLYASPEQVEGLKTVDHRSDIWSMGVIAFECLLGWPPFTAETLSGVLLAVCSRPLPIPSEWGPVPPGFDKWFTRACNRDPAARYQSAEQAASLLCIILQEVGADARAAPANEPTSAGPSMRSQPPPAAHAAADPSERLSPKLSSERVVHEARTPAVRLGIGPSGATVQQAAPKLRRQRLMGGLAAVATLGAAGLALSMVATTGAGEEPPAAVMASSTAALHPANDPPAGTQRAPEPASEPEPSVPPVPVPDAPRVQRAPVARPRPMSPPANEPTPGGLDATAIQRTVRRYTPMVRHNCWQPALNARAPGVEASAKLSATVGIGRDGRVLSVGVTRTSAGFPQLDRCIESSVRGWVFPTASNQTVAVIPFMFVGQ